MVLICHDIDTQTMPISTLTASTNALANGKLENDDNSTPSQRTCGGYGQSGQLPIVSVPGLVQRPNAINAKRAITGHKTVEAPSKS